jgi:N-acetyl-alpha-D-glucosaminyl L-malate synthase BshA
MKIGITCYPTYGGSGIVATELGLELATRGHDVHFITYSNPIRLDPSVPRIHYHEVEVANYPLFQYPPYCLALASRMSDVAQSYNLDLLHVHYAIPHSISALLARQMTAALRENARRLPFITTLHGTDISLVGVVRSYFGITKFSIEQSDGITAVSEDLRRDTVEIFGIENEIRVIHNFVNCETYKPDPGRRDSDRGRVSEFAPDGEKLLIHLSNFRPVKRILDCIRILAEVRKTANVRLLMVGDGPERAPAERLAWTLGVKSQVDFLGKQDHVERLIRLADVIVMPSENESFGLASLEAMACGVPPVSTRVGGIPELITDGVDGFLEEVGDIPRLAGRVTQLVTDSSLHTRMGAAARHTASARFCSEKIIPQYEAYYRQVL